MLSNLTEINIEIMQRLRATRARVPTKLEQRQRARISSYQLQVKHLQKRIRELEKKIGQLEAEKAEHDKTPSFQTKINDFLAAIKRSGVRMRPCDVSNMFIERASSLEEVRMVTSKLKTIQRRMNEVQESESTAKLEYFRHNRYNLLRTFPRAHDFKENIDLVAIVFGENILKVNTDTMKFYHCHQSPTFQEYEIKMGFFDGKFTDCPNGFKQMVELRLLLVKQNQQVIVCYARALLTGYKTENYVEFFQAVKNSRCRKIPMLMTDFEWAVSRAAREVFPSITIRGCWYHFWNNLLTTSGKLKRLTCQIPNRAIFNLLTIMSMLHHPEFFTLKLLESAAQQDLDQMFKDINIKLIFYVYKTYLRLFGFMFFLDLEKASDRTNNAAEGSNAQLSRVSGTRLKRNEFAQYAQIAFKKDIVKKPSRIKALTETSAGLLEIQIASKTNVTGLFDFLYAQMAEPDFQIAKLRFKVPSFDPEAHLLIESESEACWKRLDDLYSQYKAFRKMKREEWKARKRSKRDGITALSTMISEYHEKKIMNKPSRNAKKERPSKKKVTVEELAKSRANMILEMSDNYECSNEDATDADE